MDVHAYPDGRLRIGEEEFKCALGRGGVVPADEKKEGDGATPAGTYFLRKVFFRPDKISILDTDLPAEELTSDAGWCDEPADPKYNRFVKLPYPASAENLWREDELYDIIVVVGYNDDPPAPEKGSAIFLHVARKDYAPTAGCVALSAKDLFHILPLLGSASKMIIHED